eukprot:scaffold2163_cov158-Ochromonas_danica.AAC.13
MHSPLIPIIGKNAFRHLLQVVAALFVDDSLWMKKTESNNIRPLQLRPGCSGDTSAKGVKVTTSRMRVGQRRYYNLLLLAVLQTNTLLSR